MAYPTVNFSKDHQCEVSGGTMPIWLMFLSLFSFNQTLFASNLFVKDGSRIVATGTLKEVYQLECEARVGCAILLRINNIDCMLMSLDGTTQQFILDSLKAGKSIACVLDRRAPNTRPTFFAPKYEILN